MKDTSSIVWITSGILVTSSLNTIFSFGNNSLVVDISSVTCSISLIVTSSLTVFLEVILSHIVLVI